ncbi:LysM domain protein [Secundilactobacillus pentosiphilus]|uniref:LysM domain protein n=1 Tax=Secundilactobacillus pentosiphilus TaxID=1714682 RepID=A0A1Z5IQM9_9LACO|nr:LysM peptidoglycan-binding domain-containing protein [Secundilactobacillus pentosiphilus]GAX04075.1 LysM domain protein [Secundilactobacillus pentosiphilus]
MAQFNKEDFERYVVKPGDSEFTIAQQFHTSVGLLRKVNARLSGAYNVPGRKIYVPKQK